MCQPMSGRAARVCSVTASRHSRTLRGFVAPHDDRVVMLSEPVGLQSPQTAAGVRRRQAGLRGDQLRGGAREARAQHGQHPPGAGRHSVQRPGLIRDGGVGNKPAQPAFAGGLPGAFHGVAHRAPHSGARRSKRWRIAVHRGRDPDLKRDLGAVQAGERGRGELVPTSSATPPAAAADRWPLSDIGCFASRAAHPVGPAGSGYGPLGVGDAGRIHGSVCRSSGKIPQK